MISVATEGRQCFAWILGHVDSYLTLISSGVHRPLKVNGPCCQVRDFITELGYF